MVRRDPCADLLSHNLNNHSLVTLPIELSIKDSLPGSKVELPIGYRHDDLVMNQQGLQMRVAVILARLMMPVIRPERRQPFEPLVNVLDQSALIVIHIYARRNMHR